MTSFYHPAPSFMRLAVAVMLITACDQNGTRGTPSVAGRPIASDSSSTVARAVAELREHGFGGTADAFVVRCYAERPWGVVLMFTQIRPDSVFSHAGGAVVSVMRSGEVRLHPPLDGVGYSVSELPMPRSTHSLIGADHVDSSAAVTRFTAAVPQVTAESLSVSCFERRGQGIFLVMSSSQANYGAGGPSVIVGAIGPKGEGWVLHKE